MTIRPAEHKTAGTQPGCEGLARQWKAGSPGSPCTAGLSGDAVDTEKSPGSGNQTQATLQTISLTAHPCWGGTKIGRTSLRFERAGRERSRGIYNDVKPNPVLTAFLWDPWCKARQEPTDSFRGLPESQNTIHYSFLKSSLTREPRHQKMRTFSLKTKIHSKISIGLGALGYLLNWLVTKNAWERITIWRLKEQNFRMITLELVIFLEQRRT